MPFLKESVARATGLEPATSGVTGRHSNRLSYARAFVSPEGLASLPATRRGLGGVLRAVKQRNRSFAIPCAAGFRAARERIDARRSGRAAAGRIAADGGPRMRPARPLDDGGPCVPGSHPMRWYTRDDICHRMGRLCDAQCPCLSRGARLSLARRPVWHWRNSIGRILLRGQASTRGHSMILPRNGTRGSA